MSDSIYEDYDMLSPDEFLDKYDFEPGYEWEGVLERKLATREG